MSIKENPHHNDSNTNSISNNKLDHSTGKRPSTVSVCKSQTTTTTSTTTKTVTITLPHAHDHRRKQQQQQQSLTQYRPPPPPYPPCHYNTRRDSQSHQTITSCKSNISRGSTTAATTTTTMSWGDIMPPNENAVDANVLLINHNKGSNHSTITNTENKKNEPINPNSNDSISNNSHPLMSSFHSDKVDVSAATATAATGTGAAVVVDEEDEEDFIMRMVDGPCQGAVFPCTGMLPVCQARLEQQLDLFTHCRQPLAFLSFFQEYDDYNSDSTGGAGVLVGVEVLPTGMYVVPSFCEYCGATHTRHCDAETCQRPRLYFQKKRPPFSKPDNTQWDPRTDYALPNIDKNSKNNNTNNKRRNNHHGRDPAEDRNDEGSGGGGNETSAAYQPHPRRQHYHATTAMSATASTTAMTANTEGSSLSSLRTESTSPTQFRWVSGFFTKA